MQYLGCLSAEQGTQFISFKARLAGGDPKMTAALELILPGDAAEAAASLDIILSISPLLDGPEANLPFVDGRLTEAWARLSRCPSYLKLLKERDLAVAETIRQWPALKKIYGL